MVCVRVFVCLFDVLVVLSCLMCFGFSVVFGLFDCRVVLVCCCALCVCISVVGDCWLFAVCLC